MKNFTLVILISLIFLSSCGNDEAKLKIADFTTTKTIVLEPINNYPYTMMNVWVKGFTNDTILVKLNFLDSKPILKLSGAINERWYTDYYGEGEISVIFEPYKATAGKLEIRAKL